MKAVVLMDKGCLRFHARIDNLQHGAPVVVALQSAPDQISVPCLHRLRQILMIQLHLHRDPTRLRIALKHIHRFHQLTGKPVSIPVDNGKSVIIPIGSTRLDLFIQHFPATNHTDKKVRRHVTHRPLTACLAQQMDRLDLSRICRGDLSNLDGVHQRKSTVATVLKGVTHAAFRAFKVRNHDRRIILSGRQNLRRLYPPRDHRRKTAKQNRRCQPYDTEYRDNHMFTGKCLFRMLHDLAPFPSKKEYVKPNISAPLSAAHLLVSEIVKKLHTKVKSSPFAQNSPFCRICGA